jgi:O-antigen/teichoic acid export membrane protein
MGAAEQPTHAEPKQGYAATAASGSAWTSGQLILNKLVTIAAGVLLTRMLSPSDYGLAFFVVNLVAFVFVCPAFVMGDVLLADRRRFQEIVGAANVVMWAVAFATFATLAAAAIPIERFDGRAGVALLILFAATRPLSEAVLAIPHARMRMDLEYRRIATIDGCVSLAATAGSLAMAYFGAGAVALILPPISTLALRGAFYWRIVRSRIDLKVRSSEIRPVAHRFVVAGLGQYVNNILLSLEIVVLGLVTNEAEVGLFVLAATYAIQANLVIAGQLGSVLQPIFARMHDDPRRQVGGFLRATRILCAIAVPLSLVQAALAVPLFEILFLPEWRGSSSIFAVLSIAQAFIFISAPSLALLKAQGRFRANLALQLGQLTVASLAFVGAVLYCGPWALEFTASCGLPADQNAGKALALGFVSAAVSALFCPLAVWLAGRPAALSVGATARLFLEPWAVAAPIALLLVAGWSWLRSEVSISAANLITVLGLAPIAAIGSMVLLIRLRRDTREDVAAILSKVRWLERWVK